MKYVKRVLAVVLVLVLVLSLSGCTAFETKMAKASSKMKKVDNLRADVGMVVDLDMTMLGQSIMDMDFDITGTFDIDKKNLVAKGFLNLDMMGEETAVLLYIEKDGDVVRTYTSNDNGQNWVVKETQPDPENPGDLFSLFDVGGITDLDKEKLAQLTRIAETFEETGTSLVRGSEATLYTGQLSLDDLQDRSVLTELLNQLNDSMGTALTEADLAAMGKLPVTIGIDNKTGMITKIELDMTDMIQSVAGIAMDIYMAQVLKEQGLEGMDLSAMGVKMKVNECTLEADLYDFDAVGDVVIPNEVRENAVPAPEQAA